MDPSPDRLQGLRILVAEDELLILLDIETMLHAIGCTIVGPVATVAAALAVIDQQAIDGALLDMNLHGQRITPAAEKLAARGIPFVLCTGYGREPRDEAVVRDAPRLTKPIDPAQLRTAMRAAFLNRSRE